MLEVIVVVLVLVFLILSLFKEWFQPAISFLIAVIILGAFGILSGQDILQGFGDQQIASILLLIVFGNLLGNASILDVLFSKAFETTKTYFGFMSRLLPSVSVVSAFMNNTPIVALLIPYVYKWGKQNHIPISKLLIPLSFAAILGGTITLVGTSTNMLVNAFATSQSDVQFSIFDFTWVGLPLSIIGLAYIIIFGKKLLPVRTTISEAFTENTREYIVETHVPANSSYIGKSIREANLRELNGLFVVEIIRGEQSIVPVRPSEVLQQGDILILAGNTHAITDLIDLNVDLKLPEPTSIDKTIDFDMIEVVVAQGSHLANKQVKHSDFRRRYNSSLLAVNRKGEQLHGKLGDKTLRTGDTLLITTGNDFETNAYAQSDFYQISKIKEVRPLDVKQSLVVALGMITAIILSSVGILSLFKGLLILLLICLLARILSFNKLNRYMDYNLLVIAALALALGKALETTGISASVAQWVVTFTEPVGVLGALCGIYLLSFVFTELMTNIAAASLALPFGLAVANQLGVTPEPFFLAIAYAASASFITPVGYQTNLMIYGPGGYKFKDFLHFGLPLSIVYFIVAIAILYWRFFM